MGEERTQVETEELRRWSRGARERSDWMNRVADEAGRTDVGLDVFGAIHRAFGGGFIDQLQNTLDEIRNTARYLEIDSTDSIAVADSFDEVNQTQADRFRRSDGHA